METRILIVEDEDKIARLLEMELTHEGYIVERSENGELGLEKALAGGWNVILLDVMLPGLSGIELLSHFRQKDPITPVILLTARGLTSDKVVGLDQGANDYLTKPFQIEELLARIRVCIRNKKIHENIIEGDITLRIEDLTVSPKTRVVVREQTKIELTPKEFDLLLYLMENCNQVLTREQIMKHVWGYQFVGDTNVVDVYIRYLRRKVDYPFQKQYIQTYRGIGYTIKGDGG